MGIIGEFRNFAIKGNVVDMAVGIVVGVAFNAIVNSLVNDVIMPPIGLAVGVRCRGVVESRPRE